MKKYEFVKGDTKTATNGATLRRIRAVVAIAAFGVAAGDLGGYIEDEKNLSHSGDAWVSGNAWVYGDARVYGNAQVYGNAGVYGNARVYGNAWVYGDARVYGDAGVSGNARVYGDGLIFWASKVGSENGTLTVYHTNSGELEVTRGCFRGSVDEFLLASESKHDDDTHIEYRLLIEVAVSRITRALAKMKG